MVVAVLKHFTDRSEKVIILAHRSAIRRNKEVGTEDILTGLLEEGTGIARTVLNDFGLDPKKVRLRIEELFGHTKPETPPMPEGEMRTSAAAEKVVYEYAPEEAGLLGHGPVGTEHLLLGLLRGDEKDPGIEVLTSFGIKTTDVRERILRLVDPKYEAHSVSYDLWQELAMLLNRVADEREEDSDGPGSMPSDNARQAKKLMEKIGIERNMGRNVC